MSEIPKKRGAGGSEPRYEEKKKRRHLSVTQTAWETAQTKVKEELGLSVSEAIELIGRGKLKLVNIEK